MNVQGSVPRQSFVLCLLAAWTNGQKAKGLLMKGNSFWKQYEVIVVIVCDCALN